MLDCDAYKEKRNKLTYIILHTFNVILYDFTNCSVFLDVKQTLHYKLAME